MTAERQFPGLIDTHAHLQDGTLRGDLAGVLARGRSAGVCQVMAGGTTAVDSGEVVAMAHEHPGVFAAIGIHPNEAARAAPGDWERIVALADDSKVHAIGESGLDRYRGHTPFHVQQEWFGRHLELAVERGLPIIIHSREADRDIIKQLWRLARPVSGVLHSFTGSWDDAQELLVLGLHLSFAGMITFGNKGLDALREVAARMPIDRLLVETDSPYLSPHPYRGQTNEPARVAVTAAKVAELRGIDPADLAERTSVNARRLFGLPEFPML
jgi:TatD DNase family protein